MKLLKNLFYRFMFIVIICGAPTLGMADGVTEVDSVAYTIKLTLSEKYKTDYRRYTFRVYDKLNKKESSFEMESMITDIERLEIIKDRLVVIGEVSNVSSGVAIIDLKQSKEIDFILCYRPQFSETKKYIIYEKFYPRFVDPQVLSDLILIYDLDKSPMANRVGETGKEYENIKKKIDGVGAPRYLRLSEKVGYPIYPEDNIEKQSYRVWVEQLELRHFIFPKGTYLWFNNDKLVVMLDRYKEDTWVILVDLSDGLNKVKIKKIKVEPISSIYE